MGLPPGIRSEKEEVLSAIEEVLNSGWLILGIRLKLLKLLMLHIAKQNMVGVANGTDAIFWH